MAQFVVQNGQIREEGEEIFLAWEPHACGFNECFDRFGAENFRVIDTGNIDRAKVPAAQEFLDKLLDDGISVGGMRVREVTDGASNRRNGCFVDVNENIREEVFEYITSGIDLSKLCVEKDAKYSALALSSVKSWAKAFHDKKYREFIEYPHPSKWAIMRDVEVPAVGVFDEVTPLTLKRVLKLADDGETNVISDGGGLYVIEDENLTPSQRKFLLSILGEIQAWTIRASLCKIMLQPILKSALRAFFEETGGDPVQKDYWGDAVNLLEQKVIAFNSGFKAAKCVNHWSDYVEAFDKYAHQVWVCVQPHPEKVAALPYQQLQTLDLTSEEVEKLAKMSADCLLSKAKPGDLGKVVGGWLGKCLDAYPALAQDPFVKSTIQKTWLSKARLAFGGRVLGISHNTMCAMDTWALLQGITGQKITGLIPAMHIRCALYKEGEKVGATRSPHLDHAWAILSNVADPFEGLYLGKTIYYSCADNCMKMHQMDFDGDKSNLTNNKTILDVAIRSKEAYGNECLLYAAADAGTKPKGCENYFEEFKELCRKAFNAPIGLYANALTKIWAMREPFDSKKAMRIACLTRKGNTCIDEAGGHGTDSSSGVAEDEVARLRLVKKPWFLRYAKGSISPDGKSILLDGDPKKYRYYKQSVVDQYSAICRLLIPELVEEVVDYKQFGEFDNRMLMSEPNVKGLMSTLAGLISDDGGIFNQIISDTSAEEALIMKSSSMAAVPDFKADKAEAIELAVADFALSRGVTLDRAIDYLVFFIFYRIKRTGHGVSSLKRWLFITFGDRILRNILNNSGKVFSEDEALYDEDDEDYDE